MQNTASFPDMARLCDSYGVHGINIFGDSLAHGSGAPAIYNDSFAGIFRRSVNALYGGANYGYASMMSTLWPGGKMRCSEIHEIMLSRQEGGYSLEHDDRHWSRLLYGEHLGGCSMVSGVKGASMKITLAKPFNYLCAYYMSGADKGTFRLTAGGDVLADVDCAGHNLEEKRTAYIDISKYGVDTPIFLENTTDSDGREIKITGFAYYNDPSVFTVNNYSLGGRCLHYQTDKVIAEICKTSTLIVSLGYNDANFCPDKAGQYSSRIDAIAREAVKNGTSVYVIDCIWNFTEENHFRSELRRLARETGGALIDMTPEMGGRRELFVDEAHPTAEGHRMIAQRLLDAAGIPMA